ncbi:MAG: hypothetical protein H7X77_03990, partial [Anaerolineae bacterium]|nr:hypothetical protein [Anaerolineae bacterium]
MMTQTRRVTYQLLLNGYWQPLLTLWLLAMIAVPLAPWLIGEIGIPAMAVVTTLLQFGV